MKKVILIFTLVLTAFAVSAQTKVGHINSSELLEQMPEAKEITTQLEKEQADWQDILAKKEAQIRDAYNKYLESEKDASISKDMLEVMAADVEGQQTQYQELQQKAGQALQTKQQEMLAPLLEKVKVAIEEVAKSNGYDYVIDAMEGSGIIYSNPSNDIMPLVKAKLGIL